MKFIVHIETNIDTEIRSALSKADGCCKVDVNVEGDTGDIVKHLAGLLATNSNLAFLFMMAVRLHISGGVSATEIDEL